MRESGYVQYRLNMKLLSTAAENELLLRPIGRTVYLMPPYVLDDDEVAGLAARTIKTFESVIAG